ncbi:MAG: polysaccharide deacetylase family protein [Ramlibacter sp.]|nr:polysaccharide deacetylase family protein [Cryobacterium sp.]
MLRRTFIAGAATVILSGCAAVTTRSPATLPPPPPPAAPTPGALPRPRPSAIGAPVPVPQPAPALARVPVPAGSLFGLPGDGALLAWTVDDGTSEEVVGRYIRFAAESGTRLTFFLNGTYEAWTIHADLLRPLVQSGQIQLGNHTWSHSDLTGLTDAAVTEELRRNHDFITELYGVDARPYFRPSYAFHDERVDSLAADLGYTVPTLWYGSLSDSGLITEQRVLDFAGEWFQPGHIVIGHLNFPPVTQVFPQLRALVAERGLRTVTLNDVFTCPAHP